MRNAFYFTFLLTFILIFVQPSCSFFQPDTEIEGTVTNKMVTTKTNYSPMQDPEVVYTFWLEVDSVLHIVSKSTYLNYNVGDYIKE